MLVLASNSPRRKELLALGGWDFCVSAAQVDERVLSGETPESYVRRLAQDKARASAELLGAACAGDVIVAADTAVVDCRRSQEDGEWRDEILGKPDDYAEAESMLRRLRGRTHRVFTGVAVLRVSDKKMLTEVCLTEVPMRAYSDQEMMAYIASGDALDKAGAYAIQHQGFSPVENLSGCYANVMGLPICHLACLLVEFEVSPAVSIPASCQAALGYPCEIYRQVLD